MSVHLVSYLGLCLHDGGRHVADLDERLGLVVVVVLLLRLVLVGDDHHRLHVFGQRGRVQEVRRRLREGGERETARSGLGR